MGLGVGVGMGSGWGRWARAWGAGRFGCVVDTLGFLAEPMRNNYTPQPGRGGWVAFGLGWVGGVVAGMQGRFGILNVEMLKC